jgi:hypothetical protein
MRDRIPLIEKPILQPAFARARASAPNHFALAFFTASAKGPRESHQQPFNSIADKSTG